LSLFAEMRALLEKNSGIAPQTAVEMATLNGAAALGQQPRLGCIRAGASADLIALPCSHNHVFESIVAFDGVVPWMMLRGEVLPG
jgi:cytosine/adenosine deaminase-related metal-dependent hydrolase